MKLIFLTLILCTNVFGAAVMQQQVLPSTLSPPNIDEKPSNEEKQIAILKQTVVYLALPAILIFFKPELHESITPSIEEALNEIDVSNIVNIIHLLEHKFEDKNDNEISPEAIKHLIIGMSSALSLIEQEDSQHQEEQNPAKDEVLPQKVTTPAAPTLVESLVTAPHPSAVHTPAFATPHSLPNQAIQAPHAPANITGHQLAQQKDPSPAAHKPLRHQATRNTNLKSGI